MSDGRDKNEDMALGDEYKRSCENSVHIAAAADHLFPIVLGYVLITTLVCVVQYQNFSRARKRRGRKS